VRDSATHAISALDALSETMVKESSVEYNLSTHTTDLVARVRFKGQEAGWADAAAQIKYYTPTHETIRNLAQKRVDHITIELDAALSMYHFALNSLNAVQASRKAVFESLRSKVTFLQNVNILPPEILLTIFWHTVVQEISSRQRFVRDPDVPFSHKTEPIRSPLTLQAVCRQWRDLAQSCSELWQGLTLYGRDSVSRSGLSPSEQKQLSRIDYYLERNQSAPLELIIHVHPNRVNWAFFNAGFSRLKGRSIKRLLISAKNLDINLNPTHLPNELQTYLPNFEGLVKDVPTAQVIEMVPWNTGNGRPTLTFRPRVGWFYSCRSFICHGVVPLLEPPGAEQVTHLSVTRTSRNNWNLNDILHSFPNLTHLEIDPTRTGCRQSLSDLPTVTEYTASFLQHITTSIEGLDDVTKFLQVGLSLPSLSHLTLVDTAPMDTAPVDNLAINPWPVFITLPVAEQITTFEVLHCSNEKFPTPFLLKCLHTLKLHSTAVTKGNQSLIPDIDELQIAMVPPSLKEVHYIDSDIEGETALNILSRIREDEEYKEWTCGMRFSGCPNVKSKALAALRERYGEPFSAQYLSVY
jgi:F-box-like